MFGGVYLQYGLVPSIVLHFVFDVVWFALPLFASPSRLDQALVLFCAFAPLWLVLAKRWLFTGRSATPRVRSLLSPLLPNTRAQSYNRSGGH
jgi:hypothetical protein